MQNAAWLMVAAAACGPVVTAIGPVQAQAVFSMNGVQGTVLFEQDAPQAKSRVTVKLSGLIDANGPYPWHVHEQRLPLPQKRDQQNVCEMAGDHFDVDAKGPSRWDMGKMTSVGGEVNEQRVLDSGVNVSLSGPDSIVGHSIVIHKAKKSAGLKAPMWVCANIGMWTPISAWALFSMDGVGGSIQLSQGTNGSESTQIAVDLIGLKDGPNPWHVHQKPVHGGDCGESSTGDHFGSSSVWDLSTKHGKLSGPVVRQSFAEETWAGLPLFGPDSVVGKSIVIYKANNHRWVCATIVLRPACHDDPSWKDDDPDGTGCENMAGIYQYLQHNDSR